MKILTKEDAQVVKSFQKHFFKQAYKKIIFIMLIMLLLGIVLILLGSSLGIFMIIFPVVFLIILPISQYLSDKKLNNSSKLMMSDKMIEYEFFDDKFSLKCYLNDELIQSALTPYSSIFKVEETPEFFFLYLAMNQALTIIKKDMSEEQINELRGILQVNCLKYKLYK